MMAVVGLPKVVEDVSKLQSEVAVVATLVDRLEDSVDRFDRQTETLHARISSGEREIKQKIDEQYDELMKEIKEMRAESTIQHNTLSGRITAMEKWMWTVIGGSAIVGALITLIPWDKFF